MTFRTGKRISRKLYEKILSGRKSKFVVTLDEAYVQVRQKGRKRGFYYIGMGQKVDENLTIQVSENFS